MKGGGKVPEKAPVVKEAEVKPVSAPPEPEKVVSIDQGKRSPEGVATV